MYLFCRKDWSVVLAISLAITFGLLEVPVVHAESTTTTPLLTIYTDKPSYSGNSTVIVSGAAPEAKEIDVNVAISNPGGSRIASTDQETDQAGGGFTVTFRTGGKGWESTGVYLVTVAYITGSEVVSENTTFSYTAPAVTSSSRAQQGSSFSSISSGVVILDALAICVGLALAASAQVQKRRGR